MKKDLDLNTPDNVLEKESFLSIQELIRNVQSELMSSENERKSKGLPPLFELDGLELEIKFMVKREKVGKGKVDFRLIAIETGKNDSVEHSHTLKIRLKPTDLPTSEIEQNEFRQNRGLRPSETK